MGNRIYLEDIPVPIERSCAEIAVCQSLTGCVLAVGIATTLELPLETVSVGWDNNWTKDNTASRVISAVWPVRDYFGKTDKHKYRAMIEPLDIASFYFSLNDDSRRRLLRSFRPETVTLTNGYGWVPGENKEYKPQPTPGSRWYSRGYHDGEAGRRVRNDPELTQNELYLEKYLTGHAAGIRRRTEGVKVSLPPHQRRANVI